MSQSSSQKLCVCGQSQIFPLCDGKHKAEGWMCNAIQDDANALAFVADPHLRNLADRLAHRFRGVSLHSSIGHIRANRLVILTAGLGVDYIQATMPRVQSDETLVIGIGVTEELTNWAFPASHCVAVPNDPAALWPATVAAIKGTCNAPPNQPRPSIFLSHAVADEHALFPPITALRDYYGLSVFVCADSIEPGSRWQDEIRNQLEACDIFVLINSKSFSKSTYCAFEAGVATGLGKPVRVISLDQSALPDYFAHIQAASVPRLIERKPWLNHEDAILDALLTTLSVPLD